MNALQKEIFKQLGGKMFSMMCGVKQISSTAEGKGLVFKLGGGANKGIGYFTITLNGKDLYDLRYSKIFKGEIKVIEESNDLYCDMIVDDFEKITGFYTRM